MQAPFPTPNSYALKTVQVVQDNDAGFVQGTILQVLHARSSVFCVIHPVTQENCYIRRAEVRTVERA